MDAPLAGDIRQIPLLLRQRDRGARADDAAPTSRGHSRCERLRKEKQRFDVHCLDTPPYIEHYRPEVCHRKDCCVVDEDVAASKLVEHLACHFCDLFRLADTANHCDFFSASSKFSNDCCCIVDLDYDQVGSICGEPLIVGSSDAAASAPDDCFLSAQLHLHPPFTGSIVAGFPALRYRWEVRTAGFMLKVRITSPIVRRPYGSVVSDVVAAEAPELRVGRLRGERRGWL